MPDTRPVSLHDRVSDVLARDESLVETFVRQAPHFAKLRNRAMRRIMARLITVEQAAQTAGVNPATLVAELNAALGVATAQPEPPAPSGGSALAEPPAPDLPTDAKFVELDVREDLRSGREPFSRIMAAVGALQPGEVLRLRAIFEPVPLYSVLRRRGMVHRVERGEPDDWTICFWHAAAGSTPEPESASPAEAPPLEQPDPPDVVRLDVRGLEPPEPMLRTLAELETLPRGHTLVQVNARVPQFLLPMLVERGFDFALDDTDPERVLLRIRHRG